jgi:hypothetical protein
MPIVALAFGIAAALGGVALVAAYVWEAVVTRWGEPDQSLLLWYLPILFLGVIGVRIGLAAGTWGLARLRSAGPMPPGSTP